MEPINFKLLAEKCTKVVNDIVQGKDIYDIEIEEFSSNNKEIFITIGYSYNKYIGSDDPQYISSAYFGQDPEEFIEVRKYKRFTFDRTTLEIISMGMREANPRQNRYERVLLPPAQLNNYLNKGYLLDTNIVLEYIHWVSIDKKTFRTMGKSIHPEAAQPLLTFLDEFFQKANKIYTTPNIITEITNLIGNIDKNPKMLSRFYSELNKLMKSYNNELYIKTEIISKKGVIFQKLGLTDATIFEILENHDILFLSFDSELINELRAKYRRKIMNVHSLLSYLEY